MIGIIWGLVGALFIGVSDGIARVTAQRTSLTILILFIMGTSTIVMTVWLVLSCDWPKWHFYSWLVSILSGFLNILALALLYKALARGPVSVASPATSSFSIILVALNALAGEPFNIYQGVAAILVFFGIAMLTRKADDQWTEEVYSNSWLRKTALLGLGAGATVALRIFLAQEAVTTLGAFHALYLNRAAALILILLIFFGEKINRQEHTWPAGSLLMLVILQSLLEMLALGALLLGSSGDGRVGAAIGFSSFAAVSTFTAWIWLGEKVPPQRMIWIGIIAAAIVIAIIFEP